MNVLSVGAGAVGGTIAARLSRSGVNVAVVDADAGHVALLRDPGLVVGGLEDGSPTALDAATAPRDMQPDVILLAVRSHATEAALGSLAPVIGAATDVVSLQNGLNEDRIVKIVGVDRTIGCVVGFGATWIAPGRVELNSVGDLVIGRLDGSSDDRLEAVCAVLANAFPTRTTDNVRGALWAKMLVNSMTVLGALGGMLTGDVLSTADRRRVVADVVSEGVRVATAEGVRLPKVFGLVAAETVDRDEWHAAMDGALVRVAARVGAIKSVTWRDFELGRQTEIDAVTGEIVRRGKRSGVPTPTNDAVYAMLREIEAGGRAPAPDNLDRLAEVN